MTITVGTRVRLVCASGWRDKGLERLSHDGRAGTVYAIWGTELPPKERTYGIRFDTRRKNARPVEAELHRGSFEVIEE